MSKTRLIDPDYISSPVDAISEAVPSLSADAGWIAGSILTDEEFHRVYDEAFRPDDPGAYTDWVIRTLQDKAEIYQRSRDAVLASAMIEFLNVYRFLPRPLDDETGWSLYPFINTRDIFLPRTLPRWAEAWIAREDIDWDKVVTVVSKKDWVAEMDVELYRRGRLQATSFVKADFHLSPKLVQCDYFNDRASPCYWVMLQVVGHWLNAATKSEATVPGALAQMYPMFHAAGDEEKVKVASAMLSVLGRCWHAFSRQEKELYELVAHDLLQYFRDLDALADKHPDDRQIMNVWWFVGYHVFSMAFGNLSTDEYKPTRVKLLDSALNCLGYMRVAAKNGSTLNATDLFDRERFFTVFACANSLGSRWTVLKPLLLAFASLNTQAVAKDLRYWPEKPNDDPPYPWCEIPTWISAAMQPGTMMDIEREQDHTLLHLRTEFAKFCLSRIKTRKPPKGQVGPLTNDDFVETRPIWRLCYIRAVRDLKVNPEGKGHHILFWASTNDPDPEVREQAKISYKELRHGPALEAEHGPRRPLYAAFWWLRQAHLLGLGIEPDAQGARRTREKEVRRASERL